MLSCRQLQMYLCAKDYAVIWLRGITRTRSASHLLAEEPCVLACKKAIREIER